MDSPKVRCHISIASAMNRSSFTLVIAFVRILIPIGILQGTVNLYKPVLDSFILRKLYMTSIEGCTLAVVPKLDS